MNVKKTHSFIPNFKTLKWKKRSSTPSLNRKNQRSKESCQLGMHHGYSAGVIGTNLLDHFNGSVASMIRSSADTLIRQRPTTACKSAVSFVRNRPYCSPEGRLKVLLQPRPNKSLSNNLTKARSLKRLTKKVFFN